MWNEDLDDPSILARLDLIRMAVCTRWNTRHDSFPFGRRLVAKVSGDRSFTTSSLVESTMGKDVIRETFWNPASPNRLALTLRGGVKVENVVMKRSAEAPGPGQFDTSEFSKQVFDNRVIRDGPPSVKASQNLTRYRWDPTEMSANEIEAFQRVAMFPLPRDGMDFADVMGMDTSVTLYKYRVRFTWKAGP